MLEYILAQPWYAALAVVLVSAILLYMWGRYFVLNVMSPLRSLSSQIEAIRNEDFSLLVAKKYVGGCWADVQNEMRMLSELHRQQNKLVNQKVMIIFRMIEELDSPVFLLNQHARLMYGNQKFSTWLGFHWTEKNGLTPEHFGFETEQDFWRLKSSSQNGNLRCRFSKMLSGSDSFILGRVENVTDVIQETLESTQQNLMRVLSHELNNSLTPIITLSEALLLQKSYDDEVVEMIFRRSKGMLSFCQRLVQYGRVPPPNKVALDSESISRFIMTFKDRVDVRVNSQSCQLLVDHAQIEQVITNLVLNSIEAHPQKARIDAKIYCDTDGVKIELADDSGGITNLANVFTPFYSTKQREGGIGLALSRQILRLHGGELTLYNRTDDIAGTIAMLYLPANIV